MRREMGVLLVATVCSMVANLYLSYRLKTCWQRAPQREVAAWQEQLAALASKPRGGGGKGHAALALRLRDCPPCFAFLSQFALFCRGHEGACRVLLLDAKEEEMREVARAYQLEMPLELGAKLPLALQGKPTPVVWVEEQGQVVFSETVPPFPLHQAVLLLQLRESTGW